MNISRDQAIDKLYEYVKNISPLTRFVLTSGDESIVDHAKKKGIEAYLKEEIDIFNVF